MTQCRSSVNWHIRKVDDITRNSWIDSLLIGAQAAVLHETRVGIRTARKSLESLGLSSRSSYYGALILVYASWVGILASLPIALAAAPIQDSVNLRISDAIGIVVNANILSAIVIINVTARMLRKHRIFLNYLSPMSRRGFAIGSLLAALPLAIFSIKQASCFTIGVLLTALVPYTLAAAFLIAKQQNEDKPLTPAFNIAFVVTALVMSVFYFNFTDRVFGMFETSMIQTLVTVLCALISAIGTTRLARFLATRRLGLRRAQAYRSLGLIVGLTLVSSWTLSLVLQLNDRSSQLAGISLAAGTMLGILLLRVRAPRFVNPESLGFILLLARDFQLPGERIVKYYRLNWVALSFPLFTGGLALLALQRSYPGIVLLISLVVLELAIEEITIQHSAVLLPSSALDSLGIISRSGLGAGITLSVLLAASGVIGLTPSIDLNANALAVSTASLLFVLVAGVLFWIRYTDSGRWLPSLFYTLGAER